MKDIKQLRFLKPLFSLLLCVVLLTGLAACGKNKKSAQTEGAPDASATQTATAESDAAQTGEAEGQDGAAATAAPTLAPSTNKTVIHDEAEAPKVYWALDVAYHVKGCPELEGKESNEITWEMVKEIGLRQCPVCNPPQYENYIENEG